MAPGLPQAQKRGRGHPCRPPSFTFTYFPEKYCKSAEWKRKKSKEVRKQYNRNRRGYRAIDVRVELQAREYNNSGFARTKDWLMPTMDLTNVVGAKANKKCGGFAVQKNLPQAPG